MPFKGNFCSLVFKPRRTILVNLDVFILNLVILLLASFSITRTYALYENTLNLHPQWESTKPLLQRGVMGALAFISTQQPLAQNRLNLGAWFGYQEVLYRDPVDVAKFSFRFRVEKDGYVHVLYDHREDGFSGIRFSTRPDFPGMSYRATPEGAYVSTEPLNAVQLVPDSWHRAEFSFIDQEVELLVDGSTVGVLSRSMGPQRVGFRGSQRNVWIDDIVITAKDGKVYKEPFANTYRQWPRFGLAFLGLALLALAGSIFIVRMLKIPPRRAAMWVTMLSAVLLCTSIAGYALQYVLGSNYPLAGKKDALAETYWANSSREDIMTKIRAQYAAEVPVNVFRILVLGSSQTWGAGARLDEDIWVRQLEKLLNETSGGLRIECINAAVSSLKAEDILRILQTDLAGIQASAAIVNLSNNDIETVQFEQNLDAVVVELRSRNTRTILALEPNSLERKLGDSRHGELRLKHEVVRKVADRHGLPVIDLHAYLSDHKDDGFIWWDFVHLTSYGQLLVARKLANDLPQLLNISLSPVTSYETDAGRGNAGIGR
jgi:lysophospholipase L1-like esterase